MQDGSYRETGGDAGKNRRCGDFHRRLGELAKNLGVSAVLLMMATLVCSLLLRHTGMENNSGLVYVLAVVLISLFTSGYVYAIISSLIGGFFTNYYFMYPYAQFSLKFTGYPMAMLSMVAISLVVCTLTARLKIQAEEAVEREKNARQLYELNERLHQEKSAIELEKERELIRSNILRAVSHDLRTPLTSISGAASVLLEGDGLPEQDRPLVSDIKTDADALITLVENLLSVTRIQGEAAIKKQQEVLEDVAGEAVRKVRRRYPDARVELELSDDILLVGMSPTLIEQVIFNLVENSLRHAGSDKPVVLRLFRREDWAVIQVSDRGKGLEPEVLAAVRDGKPLPAPAAGDSSRGMGIGLSVCQSIISAHGGFFQAENAPEGGAVFRFGLPIEEGKEEAL